MREIPHWQADSDLAMNLIRAACLSGTAKKYVDEWHSPLATQFMSHSNAGWIQDVPFTSELSFTVW
jgi:hypothetical protein